MQQVRRHAQPRADIRQDRPDLEVQGICPKAPEQDRRCRVDGDQRVILDDLAQDILDLLRVAAIGDTDGDDDPADLVVTRPVGHRLADQVAVRDDHLGLVEGLDQRGADRDLLDDALLAAGADPIADADRTFDQQDDPADEVRHDVLQAETDTDRQGTRDDRKGRHVDPGRGDGQQRRQENPDIAQARHHGVLSARIQPRLGQDGGAQHPLHPARQRIADGEDDQEGQDRTRRQVHPAQADALAEPDPVFGKLGAGRPPDDQEDRDRRQDQAEPGQQRGQPLACAFGPALHHVEQVGGEVLQQDQQPHQRQREQPRPDQKVAQVDETGRRQQHRDRRDDARQTPRPGRDPVAIGQVLRHGIACQPPQDVAKPEHRQRGQHDQHQVPDAGRGLSELDGDAADLRLALFI